jgi:hypothetical protein
LFHRQDLKDFRSSPLGLDRQTIPDIWVGLNYFTGDGFMWRYPITNYRHLVEDRVYQFTNSIGEVFTFLYRGFHYCEEWDENALIFWEPGTTNKVAEWCASEMESALLVTDQKEKELDNND